MPYIHTASFPVRHYECDANGHVHQATYLRYMQEAAFGASAAVGFPAARYAGLGLQWFAYETDIEYYNPLRHGDTVTLKTWVQDFRRVRSLRQYIFYRNDEEIAHATTDWVLIDIHSLRPTTISQEIVDAYARGEDVEAGPPQSPLVPVPRPSQGVFVQRRRVEWRDIDPAGHVNNAVYLNYVSDCGMQMGKHYGWSIDRLKADGYAMAAQRYQILYKAPAQLDDDLEIATWMSHVQTGSFTRHYAITRDGRLLVQVRARMVWIDLETSEPAAIDPRFLHAFAANIVG